MCVCENPCALIFSRSLGIFFFAVSFAPGMLLKMLELIGFVANREKGLQYFRTIYENGSLRGA